MYKGCSIKSRLVLDERGDYMEYEIRKTYKVTEWALVMMRFPVEGWTISNLKLGYRRAFDKIERFINETN